MDPEWVRLLAGVLGGGIVGALINSVCAASRDQEARRRGFREFLGSWRSTGCRTEKTPDAVGAVYLTHVHEFSGWVERVAGDFKHSEFTSEATKLGNLLKGDFTNHAGNPQDVLCGRIDSLLSRCGSK